MSTRSISKIGLRCVSLSIAFAVALTYPSLVRAAASPQVCTVSKTCSIGEFLYDDAYAAITTGTCTFTSRNPDGTMYINAAPLTSTSDGWYAHEFTTPTTEGVYRSQICCTAGSDYLCIDKSFEARAASTLTKADVTDAVEDASPTSSEIASAVWGYSGRTLSGFSSLVNDIWSGTTRTLTGASLSSGSLATKEDVQKTSNDSKTLKQIQKNTSETRLLLEKQVNKPIIENSIEDSGDLQKKLKTSQEKAKNMYFAVAQTNKTLVRLQKSWNMLQREDRLEAINQVMGMVGEQNDKVNKETLFGTTNWFVDQWDFQLGKTASKNVDTLYQQLQLTERQLASSQIRTVYFPQSAINSVSLLKINLGEIGDDTSESSLFSEINEVTQLVADLDIHNEKIVHTIKEWKKMTSIDKEKTVTNLTRDVLALNRIPQAKSIINVNHAAATDRDMQNMVFSLGGLVKANKAFLAHAPQKSFISTWLELGSIIFKTLATNPSTLLTQDAEVKFYLPQEVKKEDVMKIDEGLTLKLDVDKGQYYVIGTFGLAPGESKVISVEVNDIWVISDQEVKTIKDQAKALTEPLSKTSYFAQGVTISSDIDVALDKILFRQKQAETPEAKLIAFREAQIDLVDIHHKLDKLKDIVTQAGSTGTLFGFVGATQTLAVWGLIIIISAGFIFLTIYMRKLSVLPSEKKPEVPVKKIPTKKPKVNKPEEVAVHRKPRFSLKPTLVIVAVMVTYGTTVASASAYITYTVSEKKLAQAEEKVLGSATEKSREWCASQLKESIPMRSEEPKKVEVPEEYATITETPTGWLRVRQTPSGSEVSRVEVGETFPVVEKSDAWFKIKLEDNTMGWVSNKYATVTPQKAETPE